ncbi:MAG: D-alanyl-D-alanine carboxypeptidase/D-alanyl-D-alanine-endopeptidase [Betaproteobacteria bacterium RIFCSPLOWO2_02_FULL_62_17]|nr:MAG: D-alanyl-D-alanine carboxypeptidase/D-alanyl-D-alanine-endopeptidase [Betaproteobacteria bacterium RIFCSPLOWO2_02_FULL_62_17]
MHALRLCACPAWLLTCAALLISAANAQPLPAPVASALAAAGIPQSQVAVLIQDVAADKPALAHNATAPMNPASTIKLLTTYAALELLGPTYLWKTTAWSAAAQTDDVLEGDLTLRGGGDPKLTFEHFWQLLRGLRARGIREIRGDLVLDRSWMDGSNHDPSKFDGEPTRPYNVGPDALLLNFKAFRFFFLPDATRRTVNLLTEPPSTALEVSNTLKLTDGPCGDWLSRIKLEVRTGGRGARAGFAGSYPSSCGEREWNVALLSHQDYVAGVFRKLWEELGGSLQGRIREGGVGRGARAGFAGSYPSSCGEREWNVALLSHQDYVAGVFRKLWEELGGSLQGRIREGGVAAGARLIATQESASLSEMVRDINKYSNNVMARQLYLTLSAELLGTPGRSDRSETVIRGWLEQKGWAMPELVLENGSGLSREERISAANLGRMLVAAFRSPVMPELLASLPLVAYDGTMRRRLKFQPVAGQAHIKTGSLSGVRSMAGYVLDRNGQRKVVVFFINHANAAAGQTAHDALLRWVYESR